MKKGHSPYDQELDQGVKRSGTLRSWTKKCFLFMSGGILIVSLFLTGSISAEAKAKSNQTSQVDDGIPKDLKELFDQVGEEFGICPELMEAMAYRESRFIPTAKNGKHYGLMQINVKVHKDRIEKYGWAAEDMFDAYKNLVVAADYLAELYELYGDDSPIVLGVYSGNWKSVSTYKETGHLCPYTQDVLERSAAYERLHEK